MALTLQKFHEEAGNKADPLISVRGITKTYVSKSNSKVLALRDVSLDVHEQEFLTIIGPSGCGKSTLLGLLAGLFIPDAGHIVISENAEKQGGFKKGYISQIDTLLPWRNVVENVEIGLKFKGVSRRERRNLAEKLMAQVGLNGFEKNYPFELSGGMKKRAAVIRTLAYNPDVIFMDEPFVGLDVQTRDMLEEDIQKLWQEHRKTIVFVTHDLAEAIALSDRIILLTARPATVKAEYIITLPRPRSAIETKFTDHFANLHKKIWQDLRSEVKKAG
jgi:NitT/TauT family transport system ATP-binding protein